MVVPALMSSVVLVFGFGLLWRFAGGRRSMSPGDVGMMLAAAEMTQLQETLTKVEVHFSAPDAVLPMVCLAGIALMVAGTYLAGVAKLITGMGALAALLDTFLTEGVQYTVVLVMTIGITWLLTRLCRLVLPW